VDVLDGIRVSGIQVDRDRAPAAAPLGAERCKICGGTSTPFGTARVLGNHDVRYSQCTSCRFVQTEEPYWLAEAYANAALIAADVGAVQRNLELAALTQTVIQQFFRADGRFLDYGGGYGLFVRLMRDRGFDFRWSDRYAENLLSRGFEADPNESEFDLVTAFEVMEHLVDPVTEVDAMLRRGAGSLLCSTVLLPPSSPKPGEWWYYAESGGQHVSLYSAESLHRLARNCGCHLVSDGVSLHLFTPHPVSERLFRFVTRRRVSVLLNRLRRRPSLVPDDFERINGASLR
jgi:hypothetical protein